MKPQERYNTKHNVVYEDGKYWVMYKKHGRRVLRDNSINNKKQMYVNGKYISQKHPLWKAGRYKSFNDAAFSSLVNYEKETKGHVYIIQNKAWPDWLKVGKAVDAEDRLKSYQTGDAFRSYTLSISYEVGNRHEAETAAHTALSKICEDRHNEWFKMDLKEAVNCIEDLYEQTV